jgi:hypothetical protein
MTKQGPVAMVTRMSESPLTRAVQVFIVGFSMPVLVGLAWWKAPRFDPYTMTFFTRTHVVPTPEMPGEMRIAGWIMIGIGALLLWVTLQGIRKKVHTLRETAMIFLMGLEIAAFGGAFFVAADSAQHRLAERPPPSPSQGQLEPR